MSNKYIKEIVLHMTSIDNVEAILASGALMAKSVLDANKGFYKNIAHQNIQDRRQLTPVLKGARGSLHDYVPFYFAPRSPMLYAIKNSRVEGVSNNQSDIVYWVSRIEKFVNLDDPFVFTDGHGTMSFTEFFDEIQFLDKIDWELMSSQYWHDTEDEPDRKRRRQAEFLIYKTCPLSLILGLVVMNDAVKMKVEKMIESTQLDLQVVVKPKWYF